MKKPCRTGIFFDVVKKGDAKRLARWWNAHGEGRPGQFEIRRSRINPRFWAVYRVC